MDAEHARNALEEARQSYDASVQLRLPGWAPPVCAVLVGGAIALAGSSPEPGWLKLLSVAGGVLCALAAAGLVLRIRARQGVVGLRGPARERWRTVGLSCVTIVVCALASSPNTRWIYAGLGVVVGAYTWVALQRKVRA
ncbi:hypothetical protein J7F03_03455 [Streptomyces sp. ISL-43]|uniref:hypothetical protein n=1 Tax=Streptomyces sp. ISL-43 TaxID=2819183 RepID=UPI001BE560C3|nr:hypothetical protein [Streptomyces sp. ISL-43]MBT2446163.1 hypothetical protein [Streptomyces sp. ISL-43]